MGVCVGVCVAMMLKVNKAGGSFRISFSSVSSFSLSRTRSLSRWIKRLRKKSGNV